MAAGIGNFLYLHYSPRHLPRKIGLSRSRRSGKDEVFAAFEQFDF
jgi:hypothetical protein